MQATKTYTLNFFSLDANSNKVWIGTAYADGTFETRWGRVRDAASMQSKIKKLGSQSAAESMLENKKREKLGKGYRETAVLSDSVALQSPVSDIKEIAKKQIAGAVGDQTTIDLIEYLADVNIHNITAATTIKYDAANATFRTPLGVLSADAIREARTLLSSVKDYNERKDFGSTRAERIGEYFRLVPRDFGMRLPSASELLAKKTDIAKENDILDALESALSNVSSDASDEQIFKCRLSKLPHWTDEGKARFREIRSLFDKTKNANHGYTAGLKLARVYEVEIEDMKTRFDAMAARIGNVRSDLWHGTKSSNLLSILRNGLIIPPASASHCTGRMFGNGIYTSNQSTKALNYATNMWNRSGAGSQRTFMFLCDVALGKTFKPGSRTAQGFPAPGTDSTWVDAGTAGVLNHECIVYFVEQINLRYLCEFTD